MRASGGGWREVKGREVELEYEEEEEVREEGKR